MDYLYETHMHTSEVSACAVSTAEQMVLAYKRRGYAGIIVTDHFVNGNTTCPDDVPWDVKMRYFMSGYENAKAAGDIYGVDVFFGWEYSSNGLDFLTYGLDLSFLLAHPDFDKLSIEGYSALIRGCGGYIAQAHPFREAWYIEKGGPVDHRLLDGVEVYNCADSFKSNEKAMAYAEQHNLPIQAGSDAHSINHLLFSGIVLRRRANDIFDIINAIKDKKARVV